MSTAPTATPTTSAAGHPAPTGMIHAAELRRLRADDPGVPIIDVRTAGEFESVHIPGSFNVPLDLLTEHVDALANFDHPVVLVCLSGTRATAAQERLDAAGKSNIHVLAGGIDAWRASDGDVVEGVGRWPLERQVRGIAGAIVATSIVASLVFPKARFVAGAVGAGLAYAAVTDSCALGMLLAKLPYNRGGGCAVEDVLAELERTATPPLDLTA